MKQRRNERISHSDDSESNSEIHYPNGLLENNSDSDTESSSHRIGKVGQQSSSRTSSKQQHTDDIVDGCLEKFKRDHPNLKKFKMSECLSDDDNEISIVEIPNNIDPNLLLNKPMNLQSNTKLKINNVKYVMKACQNIDEPLLLLTKKKRFVRPIARLKLQEYMKEKQKDIQIDSTIAETSQQKRQSLLIPEKLKNRHPIFGSDYKNKIDLDDSVKNRLNNSDDVGTTKKLKKKRKHNVKSMEITKHDGDEEKEELIFKLLRESSVYKSTENKKKKTKDEIIDDTPDITMNDGSDTKKTKKKKKIKNDADVDATVGKVQGEKESLIQKLIKDESLLIGSNSSIAEPKKKKNKSIEIKSEKLLNSTIVTNNNPDFEIDISRIDPLEKSVNNNTKKKRKIKQEIIDDDNAHKNDEETHPIPVKKSKKIKKEHSQVESSLILDILNTVKNELNSPKIKNK